MKAHGSRKIGKVLTAEVRSIGAFYADRYRRRERTGHALRPPLPDNCVVEVTNTCNHACVFCSTPRMKKPAARLPLATFKAFIIEAARLGVKETGFYSTGEPLLVRDLHEYVRAATEAGVAYTYITTNGVLATPHRMAALVQAGLKSVKFSINAATRKNYALIHGADDFERVIENVRLLHRFRERTGSDLRLLASCVLTKATMRERELHQRLLAPYCDDITYLTPHNQGGQSLAQAKLVAPAGDPVIAEGGPSTARPCFVLWKRLHLTAEGYLSLCCIDSDNALVYGRVGGRKGLMALWHNAIVVGMRRRHLAQALKGTRCHNCLWGVDEPYAPISAAGRRTPEPPPNKAKLKSLEARIRQVHGGGPRDSTPP